MKVLVTVLLLCALSACAPSVSQVAVEKTTPVVDFNQLVLSAVRAMPRGGGYSTSKATDAIRQSAVGVKGDRLDLQMDQVKPSYCSGATYLVFLRVLNTLQEREEVNISSSALKRLAVADAKDGVNVWGRWNANGPGTAKFFKDTGLGVNFTSLEKARPGDFLKIFWTKEMGRRERGHSVVYLGKTTKTLRFWSSNEGEGYGMKSAPLSHCKHLIFSRLTSPQNVNAVAGLSNKDTYLESMLTTDHSAESVFTKVAAR